MKYFVLTKTDTNLKIISVQKKVSELKCHTAIHIPSYFAAYCHWKAFTLPKNLNKYIKKIIFRTQKG